MVKSDCLFCKIANKEIPARIVFEDPDLIAFEDVKAQAPVHVLIIPKDHIGRVSDLTEADCDMVGRLILAANRIAAERGVRDSGYRIVFNCNRDAGQAVLHLHLHLLAGRKFSWPPG